MHPSLRWVHALMLAGALAPLVPAPYSILLAWALPATGLALARRVPAVRAVATRLLAFQGALVALTLAAFGLTLGHTGFGGGGGVSWDSYAWAGGVAAIWLPSGLFLALSARDLPARVATVGAAVIVGWIALCAWVLLAEGGAVGAAPAVGEEDLMAFGVAGALVVTVVLAWRTVSPAPPAAAG